MSHRVGICWGTVAIYRDLTRITVSDSKTESISHHDFRNNIRNNYSRRTGTMNYDIFPRITRLHTFLQQSIHCKDEFRILQDIYFITHTKHVCEYITPNYTSITHRVGSY